MLRTCVSRFGSRNQNPLPPSNTFIILGYVREKILIDDRIRTFFFFFMARFALAEKYKSMGPFGF